MSFTTAKKLIVAIVVLFFVMSFWQDPAGSADTFTSFVDSVGSFFSAVIDKGVTFVKGLVD